MQGSSSLFSPRENLLNNGYAWFHPKSLATAAVRTHSPITASASGAAWRGPDVRDGASSPAFPRSPVLSPRSNPLFPASPLLRYRSLEFDLSLNYDPPSNVDFNGALDTNSKVEEKISIQNTAAGPCSERIDASEVDPKREQAAIDHISKKMPVHMVVPPPGESKSSKPHVTCVSNSQNQSPLAGPFPKLLAQRENKAEVAAGFSWKSMAHDVQDPKQCKAPQSSEVDGIRSNTFVEPRLVQAATPSVPQAPGVVRRAREGVKKAQLTDRSVSQVSAEETSNTNCTSPSISQEVKCIVCNASALDAVHIVCSCEKSRHAYCKRCFMRHLGTSLKKLLTPRNPGCGQKIHDLDVERILGEGEKLQAYHKATFERGRAKLDRLFGKEKMHKAIGV